MSALKIDHEDNIPTNLRLLLLLEEVARAGVPVTPTDLLGRMPLPKPTVHRLFGTLEKEGFLQRDINGRSYIPSARLRRLSTDILSSQKVRSDRVVLLQDLSRKIGETCNIALPDRDAMIYLDRVETKWPLRIQFAEGTRVPLHCTASGKMYLSTLSKDSVARLLQASGLETYTSNTLVDLEEIEAELDLTRDRGYAQDAGEFVDGMIALAVPIRDHQERLVSTLSFHAPTQRLTLSKAYRHLELLNETAIKLSKLIT